MIQSRNLHWFLRLDRSLLVEGDVVVFGRCQPAFFLRKREVGQFLSKTALLNRSLAIQILKELCPRGQSTPLSNTAVLFVL